MTGNLAIFDPEAPAKIPAAARDDKIALGLLVVVAIIVGVLFAFEWRGILCMFYGWMGAC